MFDAQTSPPIITDLTTSATGLISTDKPAAPVESDLILGRYRVQVEAVEGQGALVWIEDTEAENAKVLPSEVGPSLPPFDVYFSEDKAAHNLAPSIQAELEKLVSAASI